jgi:DNA-binding transcriptional LysR family regulator
MKPDLNLLAVLDALCRTGSVSRAADLLALSQPAVSHALARLRAQTGDPLFIRSGRGLSPTARALALAEPVAALVASGQALLGPESFDPARDPARFRLGTSDYAGLTLLPLLMTAVRSAAPHAVVEAMPVGPAPFRSLELGTLDLSFWGADPPSAPFRHLPLFTDRFVAVLRRDHPALGTDDEPLSLATYLAQAHAVVTLGETGPSFVDKALTAADQSRRIALVSPSFAANFAAVAASDLVTAAPARLARTLPPGLVVRDLPFAVPEISYGIIWHPHRDAAPSQRWFRQLISELFKDPTIA